MFTQQQKETFARKKTKSECKHSTANEIMKCPNQNLKKTKHQNQSKGALFLVNQKAFGGL